MTPSMTPRVDGILESDIILGPLGSFHAAFGMGFMPETNSLTYIVNSVIIIPAFNLIPSVEKCGVLNLRRVAVEAFSQSPLLCQGCEGPWRYHSPNLLLIHRH